jgi:hypothetical protein
MLPPLVTSIQGIMAEVTIRLTLDTCLLQELWRNQAKRSVVEDVLSLPHVDLAVTATIHDDIPRSPLADRLRDLPNSGFLKPPDSRGSARGPLVSTCLAAKSSLPFKTRFKAPGLQGSGGYPIAATSITCMLIWRRAGTYFLRVITRSCRSPPS